MHNWATNIRYAASTIHFPKSLSEIQSLVRKTPHIRPLGTRHSFSRAADSESSGDLISLSYLDRIVSLSDHSITVEPGITYSKLCLFLETLGRALPNLASLPHISVTGSCATATHGSGDTLQCLSSSIIAMKLVNAAGEIETLHRGQPGTPFEAFVVALGALGIVVEATLATVDTFEITQNVFEPLTFDALATVGLDALTGSAYSVSLFTDFQARQFNQVWIKSRPEDRPLDLRPLGATLATAQRHPVLAGWAAPSLAGLIDASQCTLQGKPGPWHRRLPHFTIEGQPSAAGHELQAEYIIPREYALPAFEAMANIAADLRPLILVSEVRTIAADNFWASPFYNRPSIAIHFTLRREIDAVMALLPKIEAALQPFAPRPHWGKLFAIPRDQLWSNYADTKLHDFRTLALSRDPNGKFANNFLREHIF